MEAAVTVSAVNRIEPFRCFVIALVLLRCARALTERDPVSFENLSVRKQAQRMSALHNQNLVCVLVGLNLLLCGVASSSNCDRQAKKQFRVQ
jgi:hypothetical protein